jgi:hypothetical protein
LRGYTQPETICDRLTYYHYTPRGKMLQLEVIGSALCQ